MKQLTMKLKDLVRPDYTIIDGFHRWTVAGEDPLMSMLDGKVPIVVVKHSERSEDIYGTVTHNRARGTHLLEPMKAIVKELMGEGKSVEEVGKQLRSMMPFIKQKAICEERLLRQAQALYTQARHN